MDSENTGPERPATIFDVADEVGVSISTVSKALNGTGRMRAETRLKVREAADRLDYQPRRAGSEAEGKSFTIGLLTTDSFSRFASPIMLGVEDALGAGDVSVLLADGRGDPIRENHHLQTFLARRVDGIIVTGRRSDARPPIGVSTKVPVCYVLTHCQRPDDLSVVINDEQGAALATAHLLAIGRRGIAQVTGPRKHLSARLRDVGVRAELAAAGVEPVLPTLWGGWSEAWGRQAASILIRSGQDFDGVVCGSDQVARGVAEQLQASGRRVPEDVSVTGFDNWDVVALAARPPLTTVDPQLGELGRLAGESILRMHAGEHRSGVLPHDCELIIRGSTVATTDTAA